jgi:hypothetical protein
LALGVGGAGLTVGTALRANLVSVVVVSGIARTCAGRKRPAGAVRTGKADGEAGAVVAGVAAGGTQRHRIIVEADIAGATAARLVAVGIGGTGQAGGEGGGAGETGGRADQTGSIRQILEGPCVAVAGVAEQVAVRVASSAVTGDNTALVAGIGAGWTGRCPRFEVTDRTVACGATCDDPVVSGEVAAGAGRGCSHAGQALWVAGRAQQHSHLVVSVLADAGASWGGTEGAEV